MTWSADPVKLVQPRSTRIKARQGLHGHFSSRAAVCRGMPFCPCYSGVDLARGPDLCCFCVSRKAPGQSESQGSWAAALAWRQGRGPGEAGAGGELGGGARLSANDIGV